MSDMSYVDSGVEYMSSSTPLDASPARASPTPSAAAPKRTKTKVKMGSGKLKPASKPKQSSDAKKVSSSDTAKFKALAKPTAAKPKSKSNNKPKSTDLPGSAPQKPKKKKAPIAPPPPPMSEELRHVQQQQRSAGMLSVLDLCGGDDEDEEEMDTEEEDGRHTPIHQHEPFTHHKRPFSSGPHDGYDDGVSSVDEDSVVDSESGSIKTPPKKPRVKKPRLMTTTTTGDGDVGEDDDLEDDGWSDHNRWYCNICKDGGELLCCDRCPRAFHMSCLGMAGTAIPDTEWFCKMCAECLDRRRIKRENREKARLLREAAKLERDATKRAMQQQKEDLLAQKSVEAIEFKAKRVLESLQSKKKVKYKDKEEEKLGKLAEDLVTTVRIAKEKLDKIEKEDAALKKREEAFHKKKKTGAEDVNADGTTTDKPPPTPCAFGEFPADQVGDLLPIWDCLTSFASVFELSMFTQTQLATALLDVSEEPSSLITEIHMCLLHLILEDREEEDYVSDDEASMDETERFRFEIQHAPVTVGVPTTNLLNSVSWPSVLYNLTQAVPRFAASRTPELTAALNELNEREYPQLSLSSKLVLLKFLIGRAYGTEKLRSMLGKQVSESVNASKEFSRLAMLDRKIALEEDKKLREKQRVELAELVEKNKGNAKSGTKNDKKTGANGTNAGDTASVEGDADSAVLKSDFGVSNGGSASDSELDDLTDEALAKNEEDLEKLQIDGFISRHEYLSRKKQLDAQREKLRRRAEEKAKKQKLQEQLEKKRSATKKGIQDGIVSKDPALLKIAIEKAKECDLPERIVVSAAHVLEILEAEAIREEEAEQRKKKFNKTMRDLVVRTEPLGRDKQRMRYWLFRGDKSHLYVEKPSTFDLRKHYDSAEQENIEPSAWFSYGAQAEVTALVASLDKKHPQEAALKAALKDNIDSITADMPVAKPGLLLSDLLNENDAKKRGKSGKNGASSTQASDSEADLASWRNAKKTWKKRNHLGSNVDVFREDLLVVEAWLGRRLKELGSSWYESGRSEWLKNAKALKTMSEASKLVLALEHEVMAFQVHAQTLLAGSNGGANENGSTAVDKAVASDAKDPEKSEEEDDDDDEDMDEEEEEVATGDDGSTLWPTTRSRDRWIGEVTKAKTLATLAASLGAFVQRLDVFGLSEFAGDASGSVTTRRAKSEKEKQSRKERAVKKKQQKKDEEEDDDTASTANPTEREDDRHSVDDWEEDCYICTEGGELLCCDGCPRVFHYPCMGLRRVPRGKTFCHFCDPSVKPVYPVVIPSERGRARAKPQQPASVDGGDTADDASVDDDDDSDVELTVDTGSLNGATAAAPRPPEDQWDVECGVCRLGGELLCCDGCPRAFHTKCIDLKTVPDDEWFCDECNTQTCGACKKNKIRLDSHVICGSEDGTRGCDRMFHLKCAKLTAVPAEDWYCPKCRKTLPK